MSDPAERTTRLQRVLGPFTAAAVALDLIGSPVAVWLDLRALSEDMLARQAHETGRILDDVRGFYADDVVGRVSRADGPIVTTHRFRTTPDAIPIPATLSLELGRLIGGHDGAIQYRFVSDAPFASRPPHALDDFETGALATLRRDAAERGPPRAISEATGGPFDRRVRIASPIVMGPVCVACHNAHPESPKRDWKVGDVRGIQEVAIGWPIAANVFAFGHLLGYLGLSGFAGAGVVLLQRRQSALVAGINRELAASNATLAAVSVKVARYLPAQVYRSTFSGARDATIATERKKLTVFFSDIVDFTATAERLQPEELTRLLNEYLTEMSAIALAHGATVDKFVDDAILVFFGDPETFFGDPETRGVQADAVACVHMAQAMQRRLHELGAAWRRRGIERPFRARMGINTGYCNVGDFGSAERMAYTIIGAEANLAARLQSIAEPGGIVLGHETYALVRGIVRARPRPALRVKGIGREVVPYTVHGCIDAIGADGTIVAEHGAGLDLYLDVDAIGGEDLARARRRLSDALRAIDRKAAAAADEGTEPVRGHHSRVPVSPGDTVWRAARALIPHLPIPHFARGDRPMRG